MASLGHDVIGFDIDRDKIEKLSAGRPPFFEPDLPELLVAGIASGHLWFTDSIADVSGADVHFIAVGTPQTKGSYAADLTYVDAAVTSLLPYLSAGDLVVGKSTIPVGTAPRLADLVESTGARLVWNPEFLREGFAVKDTISPDRLVYGVRAGDAESVSTLDAVYVSALAASTPRLVTDFATAELVKVAANAFLATKISFINAMAEVAEATGADVTMLADAIGHDARIGRRFLNSGLGFGGGCLPKDIRGFVSRAEDLGIGQSVAFLREVDAVNLRRRARMVDLAVEACGGSVAGKTIAVLGLAFKPDSDDVRDSPALEVAEKLRELGATVRATDPEAIPTSKRIYPELDYVESAADAATGADVVLVLTEWVEYRQLTPADLDGAAQRVLLDGRNCLDHGVWRGAGWTVRALGRPDH
jgi:UDPglucose 6-dehydrogenase